MSIFQPTIEDTKPNLDCVYCEVHNYLKSDGKTPTKYRYAQCNNQKKTGGFCYIDIVFKVAGFSFETSCQNCKEYVSKSQLNLF